ncbi:MAG: RluA family pseudouridine synthase [Clostridiales bacterium]|nr:RluA family pseudouridine synthase [Clostridiales bacterium]
MAKYEHTVTSEESGLTINQILRKNYKFSSRFRTKMKYQSLVDLNGTPTPGYVKPGVGDVIGVRLPQESSDFEPEDIPLDIVYEDDDLIVVNKQAGIIVHPTKGHPEHTIANAVMKYMFDSGQSFKVRFANRIDMDTTGIIIVAKNANAQNELSSQMRRNTVVKKYYALVEGNIEEDHFTVELPVGRPDQVSIRRAVMTEGGKDARSEVNVLERYPSQRYGDHTLVEVILHTGRTHQIRVHLSHLGHPIAGDSLYDGGTFLISRQALHAYYIEFDHPMTKKRVSFETDIPDDIKEAIGELKNSAG